MRTPYFSRLIVLLLIGSAAFVAWAIDDDQDGMDDAFESFFGLNISSNDADANYDTDALTNAAESLLWTDPFAGDTDWDGWKDHADNDPLSRAVMLWGHPLFTQGDQYTYTGPDWWLGGSKAGGVWTNNSWNVSAGQTNPAALLIDLDRSAVTNAVRMDVTLMDRAGAGLETDLLDTNDVAVATNLHGNLIFGTDEEVIRKVSVNLPANPNGAAIRLRRTAGEVTVYETMLYVDVDGDGLDAGQEAQVGTSDNDGDSDHDGYSDLQEVQAGTDPANAASHPIMGITCPANVTLECGSDTSPAATGSAVATNNCAPGTPVTPIAYYRFEDETAASSIVTATDSGSGAGLLNGWPGSPDGPQSSTTVPLAGIPQTGAGNALSAQFTGNDDLYDPNSANSALASKVWTDFTIECWVRHTGLGGFQTYVGRDDSGSPGQGEGSQSLFYLSKSASGYFRVEVICAGPDANGHNVQVNSSSAPALNTWYHLAAVGDASAGTLRLYVNGVSVGSASGYTGLFDPTPNTVWTIGRGQWNGGAVDRVQGFVDEVRFTDAVLHPSRFLNVNPAVAVSASDSIAAGCGSSKVITRTWTATDACGSSTSCQQTITVVDTAAPSISVPANATVECGDDTSPAATGSASGSDTCGSVTISSSDVTAAGACGNSATITRTWKATDQCGNSSSGTQTISVVDTTAPSLSVPADTTAECTGDTSPAGTGYATASDSCENSSAIAYYRFEEGTAGNHVTVGSNNVIDAAGGDDNLNAFSEANSPTYGATVPSAAIPQSGQSNTRSLSFDGGDDVYANILGPLRTGAYKDFTVEAWVRFNSLTGYQTFVGRDDSGNPGQGTGGDPALALFYLQKRGDNNRFQVIAISSSNTQVEVSGGSAAVAGTWYHVAAVGDATAGTLKLYVNGFSVGSTNGYCGLFDPAADGIWTVGRGQYAGNPADKVSGFIDEVRFSSRALAPGQFLNAGAVSYRDSMAGVPFSPFAYYRFEDQTTGTSIGAAGDYSTGASALTGYPSSPDGPQSSATVPVGTVPETGAANYRSALFTGNDDLFDLNTGSALRSKVWTDFTIECWVRHTSLAGWQTYVGRDDLFGTSPGLGVGAQSLFYLSKSADNYFRVEAICDGPTSGGHNVQVNSGSAVALNSWYHLAAVGNRTAGTLTLYVNGVPVGSATNYTGLFNPSPKMSWTIGRGHFNGVVADQVQGFMDEVRFTDHVLLPSQFLNAAFQTPIGNSATITRAWTATDTCGHSVTSNQTITLTNFVGDADADGLTAYEEILHGTNPNNADSDGDGMDDKWEVDNGANPVTDDANADPDGDGLMNLQEFQTGADPNDVDSDDDGMSDGFEVNQAGSNPLAADFDGTVVNVYSIDGAAAVTSVGPWQVDGTAMENIGYGGSVTYSLQIPSDGHYALEAEATQTEPAPWTDNIDLGLDVDGIDVGRQVLTAGYLTNGTTRWCLPQLAAGNHVLALDWRFLWKNRNVRINKLTLQNLGGPDNNQNGLADWIDSRRASVIVPDSVTSSSYVSPACLEGTGLLLDTLTAESSAGGAVAVNHGVGNRWYVNAPLSPSGETTVVMIGNNGDAVVTNSVAWTELNILQPPAAEITIRQGDSLLLNAFPEGATNGGVSLAIAGITNVTTTVDSPVTQAFSQAGDYIVNGTWTGGIIETGQISVRVVSAAFNGSPVVWLRRSRVWNCTDIAPQIVVEMDPRVEMTRTALASTGSQFEILLDDRADHYVVARAFEGGPILSAAHIRGIRVYSSGHLFLQLTETYPDGSRHVEMGLLGVPLLDDVRIELQTFGGGILFDDGTTQQNLISTDFDEVGFKVVGFILDAAWQGGVCHRLKVYQGADLVGER